jgi:hypothetical protein
MRYVGDLFDQLEKKVQGELLSRKWDKAILQDKNQAAEDLCSRFTLQEIEFDGEPEEQDIEVERESEPWPGEGRVKTKAVAMLVKRKIKPHEHADKIMNLPSGSPRRAKGDVRHNRNYLSITVHGDDWNEENTKKLRQWGRDQIVNQVKLRNEDIKMGNERVREKVRKTIADLYPELQAADTQKSQLAENLKKLKPN